MSHHLRNRRIMNAIDAATARALASPEAAQESLIKDGTYTPDGKPVEECSGHSLAISRYASTRVYDGVRHIAGDEAVRVAARAKKAVVRAKVATEKKVE